jgi:hypothetical protein
MLSALFLINQKGELILYRLYRYVQAQERDGRAPHPPQALNDPARRAPTSPVALQR